MVSEQAKRIAHGALGPLRAKWEREYGQRKPTPARKEPKTLAQQLYPHLPSIATPKAEERN